MTTGKGSLDRGKPFAYSRKERFLSNSKSNLIKNKKYPLNRFLEQCLLEDSFSCVSLAQLHNQNKHPVKKTQQSRCLCLHLAQPQVTRNGFAWESHLQPPQGTFVLRAFKPAHRSIENMINLKIHSEQEFANILR